LNNAQNRDVFLGKMLRFGVSTTGPYTIPPTNPFAAGGGKPEIFAYGLRNPWRWSFDRATGDLWLGDVGQGTREEIDWIKRGGNYGWKTHEGTACNPCGPGPYLDPVIDYTRNIGNCVVGGYVYHGSAIPQLAGTYVYADFAKSTIFALVHDQKTGAPIRPPVSLVKAPAQISSFGEGADGELYVAIYGTSTIMKLVSGTAEAGSAPVSLPQTLSATGCVDRADPTKFSSGVIPYDVNIPYWSDGTQTKHGFAIPDGTKIKVLADGHFDFPNGSVLVQESSKDGQRLHTKFFVRHADGDWSGYAYEWNQAQTDATLIRGAKSIRAGSFTSYVTHSAGCLSCHTSGAGRVLGFHGRQLNRDFSYANGARLNQLAQLEHIGLFDSLLPASAKAAPYPAVDGPEPIDARARAYLDVNCASCHRPEGPDSGVPDLRIDAPIAATGLCSVAPQHGRLDVAGAFIVSPGSPGLSVLSLRMHADDWSRMPSSESQLVDPRGIAMIDEWITSGLKCSAPASDSGGG
jgi:uncharacterized repeat protein (TIGR03806 family)